MIIETPAEKIAFQVIRDQDYGTWIVRRAANAFSFSWVPNGFQNEFETKAKALEQARRLSKWQAKGNAIELAMIDTPGAFEAVADTKYGCEW